MVVNIGNNKYAVIQLYNETRKYLKIKRGMKGRVGGDFQVSGPFFPKCSKY